MEREFIHDDFLLGSDAARELYHGHAERMPILDYHNHLSPRQVAEDYRADNIAQLWLGGDHYKWRAMRAAGVEERYVTGDASDWEKFARWAETVPQTLRNPLYHWTALELKRYFGVDTLLKPATAREIYDRCNAMLADDPDSFSARGLLRRMHVEVICTTDDPVDSLEYHMAYARSRGAGDPQMLPAWRPDKVVAVESPDGWNGYVDRLSEVVGRPVDSFAALLEALRERQRFFASAGCRVSDHGLDTFYGEEFTDAGLESLFTALREGEALSAEEQRVLKSGLLYHLAVMNAEQGWVQQFHVGPLRNNRTVLMQSYGPDAGADSLDDQPVARAMGRFFDRLDREGMLARTIVYNLNPKDGEVMAAMAGNFQDGTVPGKMQYGAAWWFSDHLNGMERQMDILSDYGLLSRFVGMLTDSRSFLSFPRHEYFRRLLCDMLGRDIERGRIPLSEMDTVGQMVEAICYGNAKAYFGF
ncbi:glucuronate isomerase [Millionella massiliensis]|uniref:glucuronate isomerase n=1 Tax=Millionella massiliensis TaxID=1871023 RepID=UPI0023A8FF11|nr:glucuronate isomerase [Millionella massiliensis]